MMQAIIEAVDRDLIRSELTKDKFVRYTTYGRNEIYIINYHNSPNIMREIGRLRELSFRDSGGGTGKELDIDYFDTAEIAYQQLIVWNNTESEIVGGYRYIKLKDINPDADGKYHLATSHMFGFTELFVEKYLNRTIELGRSFVQPKYQPTKDSRKGIFSLDNLWDGLGALIIDNPEMKYLFGKVTMYLKFNLEARDYIHFFLQKYFPDNEKLVIPHFQRPIFTPFEQLEKIFKGKTYEENLKILIKAVREKKESIPPLVNAYMNLSPSMKTFGSALNPTFGEVEEIGILLTINDIYPSKKNRYLNSYIKNINDNS